MGSKRDFTLLLTTLSWPVVYIIYYDDAMEDTAMSELSRRQAHMLILTPLRTHTFLSVIVSKIYEHSMFKLKIMILATLLSQL